MHRKGRKEGPRHGRDRKEERLVAALEAATGRYRKAISKNPAGPAADAAHRDVLVAQQVLTAYQKSRGT